MSERSLGTYDKDAMRLLLAKLLAAGELQSWKVTTVVTHIGPVGRYYCEVNFFVETAEPPSPQSARDVTPVTRALAPADCGEGGRCGVCARCNPMGL